MIVLDTHILVWWLSQKEKLPPPQEDAIENAKAVVVNVISLWELAKLVEHGRILLNCPVLEWMKNALSHPKIQLLPLTPDIIVLSTQLPGNFHKDPADQLIVATAIKLEAPLLTKDTKILSYTGVRSIS